MTEPTSEEADAFTNLAQVADWAGLPHRPQDGADTDSPRGTLLARLGMRADGSLRALAFIQPADHGLS